MCFNVTFHLFVASSGSVVWSEQKVLVTDSRVNLLSSDGGNQSCRVWKGLLESVKSNLSGQRQLKWELGISKHGILGLSFDSPVV